MYHIDQFVIMGQVIKITSMKLTCIEMQSDQFPQLNTNYQEN